MRSNRLSVTRSWAIVWIFGSFRFCKYPGGLTLSKILCIQYLTLCLISIVEPLILVPPSLVLHLCPPTENRPSNNDHWLALSFSSINFLTRFNCIAIRLNPSSDRLENLAWKSDIALKRYTHTLNLNIAQWIVWSVFYVVFILYKAEIISSFTAYKVYPPAIHVLSTFSSSFLSLSYLS